MSKDDSRDEQAGSTGIPRWAWVAAAALAALSVGVVAIGRGGTTVLIGAVLGLAALACLMLAEPDRDPTDD